MSALNLGYTMCRSQSTRRNKGPMKNNPKEKLSMKMTPKINILLFTVLVFCVVASANQIHLKREFEARRAEFFDALHTKKSMWSSRILSRSPQVREAIRKLRKKARQIKVYPFLSTVDEEWDELHQELKNINIEHPKADFEASYVFTLPPRPELVRKKTSQVQKKNEKAPKLREIKISAPVSLNMPDLIEK